jgi:hypothetical protein
MKKLEEGKRYLIRNLVTEPMEKVTLSDGTVLMTHKLGKYSYDYYLEDCTPLFVHFSSPTDEMLRDRVKHAMDSNWGQYVFEEVPHETVSLEITQNQYIDYATSIDITPLTNAIQLVIDDDYGGLLYLSKEDTQKLIQILTSAHSRI